MFDHIHKHPVGKTRGPDHPGASCAVKAVLGDHAYNVVMGSTKSMTGHLLGAAGAVEAVICTLVIANGVIPPTINFEEQDPEASAA